jgi:acylphosphatase
VVERSIRKRILLSGRVQGVWFRESCREQASLAGVAGWARNLADGRLEIVLEGAPAAVDRLVAWCGRGPSRAQVLEIDVTTEPAVGEVGFRVR